MLKESGRSEFEVLDQKGKTEKDKSDYGVPWVWVISILGSQSGELQDLLEILKYGSCLS